MQPHFTCMTLYVRVRDDGARHRIMLFRASTILCIDDEQTALQLRQGVLESAGYKVLIAATGLRGLQLFRSEPIDAVVLDYWMADMNGLQVARTIRKLNPTVPIIILSAYDELLDESLGIANLWIRKGQIGPQFLLDSLRDLLGTPNPRPDFA